MCKTIFYGLIILSFMVSCEKDDNGSFYEKIAGKTWIITKVELELKNSVKTDVTPLVREYVSDCYLDNDITFNEDSTFVETEGEQKCNAESPQVFATGTWSVSENEKILSKKYDGIDETQLWTIESFSGTRMTLSTGDDLFQLGEGRTYITFETV